MQSLPRLDLHSALNTNQRQPLPTTRARIKSGRELSKRLTLQQTTPKLKPQLQKQ